MSKSYDRDYYARWYHDPRTRIDDGSSLARKVHLAVSAAEYMLGRRIRTVLDVGAGEGRWYPALRRLRPEVRYLGVEQSGWALERWARRRHLRRGSFGTLPTLKLPGRYDLIVCADVLQYVETPDVVRGLREIARLLGGVAFIEAYAKEDSMEGDEDGWIHRSAAQLRRLFKGAGLTHAGLHCWVNLDAIENVNALEVERGAGS